MAASFFVALGLMFAPAALAHDQLIASNPEDGSELEQQPDWLELEFSGEIQEMGAEIQVMENGERDVSAGEIAVEGATLTSALPDDLAPAEYSVIWRVVSSDGHPISGEFTFTLKDDSGAGGEVESSDPAKSSDPSETGLGLGAGAVDEEPQQGSEDRGELESGDAQNTAGGVSTPMIVLLGVGALAIVVMVVLLLVRKNRGLPGTEDDAK
nr:copper resistance CopC family protein [Brevibacterium daeguense]